MCYTGYSNLVGHWNGGINGGYSLHYHQHLIEGNLFMYYKLG